MNNSADEKRKALENRALKVLAEVLEERGENTKIYGSGLKLGNTEKRLVALLRRGATEEAVELVKGAIERGGRHLCGLTSKSLSTAREKGGLPAFFAMAELGVLGEKDVAKACGEAAQDASWGRADFEDTNAWELSRKIFFEKLADEMEKECPHLMGTVGKGLLQVSDWRGNKESVSYAAGEMMTARAERMLLSAEVPKKEEEDCRPSIRRKL